ncbi:hypothetical protein MMC14_000613 [Varicellaria rhodocarpa]|nr:hypothetical protein [Varicellaria rhodocarpa]
MSESIKIIYGTAAIASKTPEQREAFFEILEKNGVKDLDTAWLYNNSEKTLGEIGAPAKFTIHTKAPGFAPGRLSKESVLQGAEKSFKQLGAGVVVDAYFLHSPDPETPIEETMDAIQQVYIEGKFKRFGLSNFQPKDVQAFYDYAKQKGYVLPTVYQGNYNAVARRNEADLFPLLRKLGISFYAYSPIAGGFLTRSPDDIKAGAEGRFDTETPVGGMYHKLYNKPTLVEALNEWDSISKESGIAKGALAYRWITYNSQLKVKFGDGVIVGASRPSQLEESLKWIKDGPLPPSVADQIEKIWQKVKEEAPYDNYSF